jgi:tRNA 2-thiouridine synthesizing protein A
MDEELEPQEQIKLEALLCDLKQLRQSHCYDCGAIICGHEALMSFTMGFKDTPKCWPCLANAMGYEKNDLRDHLFAYIKHRSCHYEGWRWASREEGFEGDKLPGCLWSADSTNRDEYELPNSMPNENPIPEAEINHDMEWNAGSMGCGDLVLELRLRIERLQPGQILKLIATDAGAPEDLPAWCRMTGHVLVYSHHPNYLIKRKTI